MCGSGRNSCFNFGNGLICIYIYMFCFKYNFYLLATSGLCFEGVSYVVYDMFYAVCSTYVLLISSVVPEKRRCELCAPRSLQHGPAHGEYRSNTGEKADERQSNAKLRLTIIIDQS